MRNGSSNRRTAKHKEGYKARQAQKLAPPTKKRPGVRPVHPNSMAARKWGLTTWIYRET